MTSYIDQWNRTNRWFARLEGADQLTTPHCDDLAWAFFQNCWHLKDWIKNDEAIPSDDRVSIETIVEGHPALMICADLANGSKHLELRKPRAGAPNLVRSLTVVGGDPSKTRLDYEVMLDDGTHVLALDIARKALAAWRDVFATLGLAI